MPVMTDPGFAINVMSEPLKWRLDELPHFFCLALARGATSLLDCRQRLLD